MFLLHLTFASGRQETRSFPTRFARALWLITLAGQPVDLRTEDLS
jgi:hypothetical protein